MVTKDLYNTRQWPLGLSKEHAHQIRTTHPNTKTSTTPKEKTKPPQRAKQAP